ncbi:hypothetical protein J6590_079238 [Homalodisca vitripennis]|nr:hypothetical protein J6590_079238 [Homalodisca vitripennis]
MFQSTGLGLGRDHGLGRASARLPSPAQAEVGYYNVGTIFGITVCKGNHFRSYVSVQDINVMTSERIISVELLLSSYIRDREDPREEAVHLS